MKSKLQHFPAIFCCYFLRCAYFQERYINQDIKKPLPKLIYIFSLSGGMATTVEKVAVLCRFLDIHSVTKNHLLKYSLAHAFCCFLTAVEDVNPAVATRAGLLLDTIKRPALQVGSLYGKKYIQRRIWVFTQVQSSSGLQHHGHC